jgi:hypothetical protein
MVGTSMERVFVSFEKVCKSESKQWSGGGVSNWFWDIATEGRAVSYDSDEDEDQHSPLHLLKAA